MHHLDTRRLHALEEINDVGGAFGQEYIHSQTPGRPHQQANRQDGQQDGGRHRLHSSHVLLIVRHPIYIVLDVFLRIGRFPSQHRNTFDRIRRGVDISARIKPEWKVLPKRWIVERSLAWINNSHRLSKDYEMDNQIIPATRQTGSEFPVSPLMLGVCFIICQ